MASNEWAVAFHDSYPSRPGHVLVTPRSHVGRVLDLDPLEYRGLFELVREVLGLVSGEGINIGVNDGAAAGQTIGHVHVHVLPRDAGDGGAGRGGIRWIFPETAVYWA